MPSSAAASVVGDMPRAAARARKPSSQRSNPACDGAGVAGLSMLVEPCSVTVAAVTAGLAPAALAATAAMMDVATRCRRIDPASCGGFGPPELRQHPSGRPPIAEPPGVLHVSAGAVPPCAAACLRAILPDR